MSRPNLGDGDMSCGGAMTRKRGHSSNAAALDNFKICYNQALRDARMSNSPVNTVKNQWSFMGRENIGFGQVAAAKQLDLPKV